MDPITIGLLAGGGIGLLRGIGQQGEAKRQRLQEAAIAQYSPWTGMSPQRVQNADVLGSVMQGGMTGAMVGQGIGGGSAGAAGAGAGAGDGAALTQQPSVNMSMYQNPYQQKYPWMNMQY